MDFFKFRELISEARITSLKQKVKLKVYPKGVKGSFVSSTGAPSKKLTGFLWSNWHVYERDGMELKNPKVMESWKTGKKLVKDKLEFTIPPTAYEVRVDNDFYGVKLYMISLNGGKSPIAFFIDKNKSISSVGKTTKLTAKDFNSTSFKEWTWSALHYRNAGKLQSTPREVFLFNSKDGLGGTIIDGRWDTRVIPDVKVGYGMLLPDYKHPESESEGEEEFSEEPPVIKNAAFEKYFKTMEQVGEVDWNMIITDYHELAIAKDSIEDLWTRNSRDALSMSYGIEIDLKELDVYMKKPGKYREDGNIDWKKMKRKDPDLYDYIKDQLIDLDSSGSISPREFLDPIGGSDFKYLEDYSEVTYYQYSDSNKEYVFVEIDDENYFIVDARKRGTDWDKFTSFIERKIYEGELEIRDMD